MGLLTQIAGVLGIGALGLGALYYYQEKLLYYPHVPIHLTKSNPAPYDSPATWKFASHRELWAETSDGERVHTWLLLQHRSAERPTIMFFHGNAGNMGCVCGLRRARVTCGACTWLTCVFCPAVRPALLPASVPRHIAGCASPT